jgi:hypothetical protein
MIHLEMPVNRERGWLFPYCLRHRCGNRSAFAWRIAFSGPAVGPIQRQ